MTSDFSALAKLHRRTLRGGVLLAFTVTSPLAGERLSAQQRVEVTTIRGGSRGEAMEVVVRRLQRRVDSLAREYERDDLNLAQRRLVGDALDRTVTELTHVSMAELAERVEVQLRVAPMASQRAAADMARTLMQSNPMTPRGWLGIVVAGAALEPWVERGQLMIRYLTHPEIVSVEPSSPAERAGLAPADTLISYDGRDVRDNDISLTRLLTPDARVTVRIRRDGRTRDVPVTIADAPSRYQLRLDDMSGALSLARAPRALPAPPAFPRVAAAPPMPSTPRRVFLRAPEMAGALPLPPALLNNGVAGAQMNSLTDGLGRTIGVRYGVLVTNAPAGSPAAASGLRDGDVIVKAAGQSLRTVPELRRLIGAAVDEGRRSVDLEIVRERRTRPAVLRW